MRTFFGVAALSYLALWSAAYAGVTYAYDDLGRLCTATYDNGKTIAYTYDPAGNRTLVATSGSPPSCAAPGSPARAMLKRKRTRTTHTASIAK
jgi:YD repeat-containing protein